MSKLWNACKDLLGTLKGRAKEIRDVDDELRRIGLMKTGALAQIEAATESDIGTAAAQRKIGDARMTIDIANMREKKLIAPSHKSKVAARKLYHETSRIWNDVVSELRKEKEAQLVSALSPFFGGDEDLVRKRIDTLVAPCFQLYLRAHHDKGYYPDQADANANLARDIDLFLSFVAREQEKLGLS